MHGQLIHRAFVMYVPVGRPIYPIVLSITFSFPYPVRRQLPDFRNHRVGHREAAGVGVGETL